MDSLLDSLSFWVNGDFLLYSILISCFVYLVKSSEYSKSLVFISSSFLSVVLIFSKSSYSILIYSKSSSNSEKLGLLVLSISFSLSSSICSKRGGILSSSAIISSSYYSTLSFKSIITIAYLSISVDCVSMFISRTLVCSNWSFNCHSSDSISLWYWVFFLVLTT